MEFQCLVRATTSTENKVPRIDRNVVKEIGDILKEETGHLEGKDKAEGGGEIGTAEKKKLYYGENRENTVLVNGWRQMRSELHLKSLFCFLVPPPPPRYSLRQNTRLWTLCP